MQGVCVALFDGTEEHPPSKVLRYIITTVVFIILVCLAGWYLLRFHKETTAVKQFLNTVASGDYQKAYEMWKPAPSFSFKDFMEDWGPNSYYGPVKSFHIENAEELKQGPVAPSGVVVTVEVSPYDAFPSRGDAAKESKIKEVRLWVQFSDQSLGYPP
jgi:hypothetical protein